MAKFFSKIPGWIWLSLVAILVMVIVGVPSWVYYVTIAVVVLTLIIRLCKKYPEAKTAILIVACLATGGTAIYSGVYIDSYLSAEGGIVGYIKSSYQGNQAVENELEFIIPNIVLKATNNENEYSATITINKKLLLDNSKEYCLFLNKKPSYYTSVQGDHINAEYKQLFYNKQDNVLCEDTLYVYIAIYENYSTLEVTTKGGSSVIKYWNSFFNKNNCVLKIEQVEKNINSDDSIVFGDGEVGEICVIKYYSDSNTLYATQVVKKGEVLKTIDCNSAFFTGWVEKKSGIELINYEVNNDISLIAKYDQEAMIEHALNYYLSEDGVLDLSSYKNLTEIPADSFVARYELKKVILPESVTKIGDRAFFNAINLKEVVGGSVTQIGNYAFTTTGLEKTNNLINSKTEFIGDFSFGNCDSLREVKLYNTIDYVGDYAFSGCKDITVTINLDSESEIPNAWSSSWDLTTGEDNVLPKIFYKGKDEKGLNYIPVNQVVDSTSEAYAVWTFNYSKNVKWYLKFETTPINGENTYSGIYQETISGFAGNTTTTTEFTYTIEDNTTLKLWTIVEGETVELMTLKYTHAGEDETFTRYLTNVATAQDYVGPNIYIGLEVQ